MEGTTEDPRSLRAGVVRKGGEARRMRVVSEQEMLEFKTPHWTSFWRKGQGIKSLQ